MNDRLNNVIERLLLDEGFLRRFRSNPERALEPYELTDAEVAAVKSGDERQLLHMGLDPAYVYPQPREGFLHAWIVRHTKRLTPALVLAAFVLPVAPAVAGRSAKARRHARYSPHKRAARTYHGLARRA